ncbi:hypothetical protein NDU88_011012 [Pleurodeles waltl]|uniref:Uncharacterized protein n=1 Tax=Pleurodeles waltl TaxID=8319 RepID=A0AAV7QZT9_PLEWA|nr:hypothetical protein NDU88_011012 [Pleurodeles waltl]
MEGRSARQPGEASTRGRNPGSGRSQGAANNLCAAKDSRGRDPLQGSPGQTARPRSNPAVHSALVPSSPRFLKKSLHREPPQPAGPPPLRVFFAGPLLCSSAAYTRGCCRGKIQDGAPVPQAGFTRPGAPSGISRAVRFWDTSLQLPRPRAGLEAGGGRARRERDRGRSRSSSRSAPHAILSPALHAHRGALEAQVGRPGLPRSSRRPGRRYQAAGGAFQDVSR